MFTFSAVYPWGTAYASRITREDKQGKISVIFHVS